MNQNKSNDDFFHRPLSLQEFIFYNIKMQHCQESTTTRTAGGLSFTAKGGKRQGYRSAPIVAGETGCKAPGLENPIDKTYTVDFLSFDI